VQGQAALGPRSGRSPARLGSAVLAEADAPVADASAHANGYSLHAGPVVPAGQRERLERVCRYVLRPPLAVERLHLTDDGRVQLSLRQPWRDGTTDLVFTPLEFLERLAVLVPRPRINLILYFGVLGARPAGRAEVTSRRQAPTAAHAATTEDVRPATDSSESDEPAGGCNRWWATLMEWTCGFYVLACPRCGGRRRRSRSSNRRSPSPMFPLASQAVSWTLRSRCILSVGCAACAGPPQGALRHAGSSQKRLRRYAALFPRIPVQKTCPPRGARPRMPASSTAYRDSETER
jgi:hypothetical protein